MKEPEEQPKNEIHVEQKEEVGVGSQGESSHSFSSQEKPSSRLDSRLESVHQKVIDAGKASVLH